MNSLSSWKTMCILLYLTLLFPWSFFSNRFSTSFWRHSMTPLASSCRATAESCAIFECSKCPVNLGWVWTLVWVPVWLRERYPKVSIEKQKMISFGCSPHNLRVALCLGSSRPRSCFYISWFSLCCMSVTSLGVNVSLSFFARFARHNRITAPPFAAWCLEIGSHYISSRCVVRWTSVCSCGTWWCSVRCAEDILDFVDDLKTYEWYLNG